MTPLRVISLPLAALVISCAPRIDESSSDERLPNQKIYWMEDSVSWVEIKDGKFGISWEGQWTIEPMYDIDDLQYAIRHDGYAYFSDGTHFALGLPADEAGRDGKWGVMDNRGNVIIPFEYEHVKIQIDEESGVTRFAGLKKNGKYAIAGPAGELLTGHDYDEFYGEFHWRWHPNPILPMFKGDRVVFFDVDNKHELSQAPDGEFEEPTRAMRHNNKWGVITSDGTFIVPPEYDNVSMAGGTGPWYFMVCKEKSCGILLTGKGLVLPMEYGSATTEQVNGKLYFIVSREDRYALLNDKGHELTDFEYDSFYPDSLGFVAWKGEEVFTIDEEGEATPVEKKN